MQGSRILFMRGMGMHDPWIKKVLSVLGRVLLVGFSLANFSHQDHLNAAEGDCARTSKMRVYSSAFADKETGDLLGYELVLGQADDSKVDALLFVYEGAPDEGIPLSGRISNGKLQIDGVWVEDQIEYPSKKKVVQTHSIRISGGLNADWFRGTIQIEGLITPAKVRLKRVSRIWICRARA